MTQKLSKLLKKIRCKEKILNVAIVAGLFALSYTVYHSETTKGENFRNAEGFNGAIIDEQFFEGYPKGFLKGVQPDVYLMKVRLDNEEERIFEYEGGKAREMSFEYDIGDIVSFKEGFKPGDDF